MTTTAGIEKGGARNALARAVCFNRLGELRDRTREGQACRAAGLNLLAAAITYWNTLHLGTAAAMLDAEGRRPSAETLAHVSPLAWEHITLTGEYRWDRPPARRPILSVLAWAHPQTASGSWFWSPSRPGQGTNAMSSRESRDGGRSDTRTYPRQPHGC